MNIYKNFFYFTSKGLMKKKNSSFMVVSFSYFIVWLNIILWSKDFKK